MKCTNCGEIIKDNIKYCEHCGSLITHKEKKEPTTISNTYNNCTINNNFMFPKLPSYQWDEPPQPKIDSKKQIQLNKIGKMNKEWLKMIELGKDGRAKYKHHPPPQPKNRTTIKSNKSKSQIQIEINQIKRQNYYRLNPKEDDDSWMLCIIFPIVIFFGLLLGLGV